MAIIGSGPGGLSAGARAAARGLSHVVLERERRFAETIQKYQRGKLVMAAPEVLPSRSDLAFAEGSREQILDTWAGQIETQRINIRYGAEVTTVSGKKGAFTIALRSGEFVEAANVVLAIGLQGNLRRLRVPGADLPSVQYQLDDPVEYADEDVVVIGAGDSAIENAVALARQNRVVIVNRQAEFARAKTGNLRAIQGAIDSGRITPVYKGETERVEQGTIYLRTPEGVRSYPCNRLIARLGGDPPSAFLKACGIAVPDGPGPAYPEVSDTYETNVPGLYAVGALVGYPLIKQCMNQGYEVIEAIAGTPVPPADEPLLQEKLLGLPGRPNVGEALAMIRSRVGLFKGLKTLQLRDLLLDSDTRVFLAGETLYRHKEFGDSLLLLASGSVEIACPADGPKAPPRVTVREEGEFFGETGLVSGRPRLGTARARTDCVVIELARRSALKLLASIPAARKEFDETTTIRQMQDDILPDLTAEELRPVVESAVIKRFKPGEKLIEEGAKDDKAAYLIRSGSVTVSRSVDGREQVLAYEQAGRLVGEMALLRDAPRSASVTAAIGTEAIRIDGALFRRLIDCRPELRAKVDQLVRQRLDAGVHAETETGRTDLARFFERVGVTEATNVLLIDESLCVRCDNCEKACADSHDGVSRLDRDAGPTFATVHVPISCRHCEHPHCMKDCPPNAIHRAADGEVWIDQETCIGCENCKENCPYGVIHMATKPAAKPGLLAWLLLGLGSGPGEDKAATHAHGNGQADHAPAKKKKAFKCDLCMGIKGGAACVRA
ncbi:MAG: cyclic nucleotide-binding domain-containing protein, partial [Gemmatimonadales bacterium]